MCPSASASAVEPLVLPWDLLLHEVCAPIATHCGIGQLATLRATTAYLSEPFHCRLVADLLQHLTDSDANKRWCTLGALSHVAEKDAASVVPAVAALLEDSAWSIRLAASEALVRVASRGNVTAAATVSEKVRHPNADVRHSAVQALGQIAQRGNKYACELLVQRLEDDVELVRRAAISTLRNVAEQGDCIVVSQVLALSDHDNEGVRATAVEALSWLVRPGDAHAVKVMILRTQDSACKVRLAALDGLVRVGPEGADLNVAVRAVAGCVADDTWVVRWAAVETFGRLTRGGDTSANEVVLRHLSHEDPDVRRAALEIWRHLASSADLVVIAAIISCVEDRIWNVRLTALQVLKRFLGNDENPMVRSAVQKCLNDDVAKVRMAAEKILSAHVTAQDRMNE